MTNLDFDILQLYFTENATTILLFKIGCIFRDTCEICKTLYKMLIKKVYSMGLLNWNKHYISSI